MKKFYLKSMGCKSNQFEGQIVAQNLVQAGYEQVHSEKEADFYILNSCSVTHKSEAMPVRVALFNVVKLNKIKELYYPRQVIYKRCQYSRK